MRQYTAWVIQAGSRDEAMFFVAWHPFYQANANVPEWSDKIKHALQFARRSDARKLMNSLELEGRPVEKQFG